MGFRINHGEDVLRKILPHIRCVLALKPLADLKGYPALDDIWNPRDSRSGEYPGLPDVIKFLEEHGGCELGLLNEYGRWDDQCAEDYKCPTCGHWEKCQLKDGHEGEHAQ